MEFQMPTEESICGLQCIWLLKNVYWEYSAGIGNIFKVFVSILPGEELFKHTRYAAILSKRIFDFILSYFQLYTISYAKPWHKGSFHLG
jgi:hypothetical protein